MSEIIHAYSKLTIQSPETVNGKSLKVYFNTNVFWCHLAIYNIFMLKLQSFAGTETTLRVRLQNQPISQCTEMLFRIFLLYQLVSYGLSRCTRKLLHMKNTEQESNSVFANKDEANTFLGRHLLFNRFDFELFTPGNLERECYEELCNFEEAREVFEDTAKTEHFWKLYIKGQLGDSNAQKVDVTALLTGLIAAGVSLVIIGLLFWYFCHRRCKPNSPRGSSRGRASRSNASLIMRRLEETSLQPVLPPPEEPCPGLPSYEQAIAKPGQHDAPPPPYPG
ncbi:TMG4 protein, partial [Atractosteus spatula]|nr:TMG4 protein [Atractosteus spatula]